jgi:hypothetical protein
VERGGTVDCLLTSNGRILEMADDSDNLVLNPLRAIRGDISQIKGDIIEIKERLGFMEWTYGSLSRRVDRLGGDVVRIKARLDIADAPAT